MADKKVEIDILIDTSKSVKTIGELKTNVEELTTAIEGVEVGSKEYDKLATALGKANTKVSDLGKSFEGLDSDARAGELGKLAGGLGAIGTAAALAFGENKKAEEFFKTFATGLAVTNAVKGGIESYTASVKLLKNQTILAEISQKAAAVAQLLYSAAVGTSTGALKLFRLALIGTGIGAIVVGLGLLIANFDKVSKAVSGAIEKFRNMGPVMKALLFPITLLIEAFDRIKETLISLGVIDDENTIKMKANAEKRVISSEKESKAISDKYDLEIRKAKAAGEETFELEKEKNIAVLNNLEEQSRALLEVAKLNGELTDEELEKLAGFKESIKAIQNDIVVNDIAQEKLMADNQIKLSEETTRIRNENSEKRIAQKKKEDGESKKAHEKELKRLKEISDAEQKQLDADESNFDLKRRLSSTADQNEIDDLIKQNEAKRLIAGEDAETNKLLDEELYQQIQEVKENRRVLEGEAEAERKLEEDEIKAESLAFAKEAGENLLMDTLDFISDAKARESAEEIDRLKKVTADELNQIDIKYAAEIAGAKGNEALIKDINKRKLKEQFDVKLKEFVQTEKINKAQFESDKKMKLGLAFVDAAKAIITSLSMAPVAIGPIPNPAGIASLAFVAASSALNIAKISSTKYKGATPPVAPAPSVNIPSAPSVDEAPDLSSDAITGPKIDSESEITGSGAGINQQPIRAIVLESDITDTQNTLQNFQEQSEIG